MSHWLDGEPYCNKGEDGDWCANCMKAWQQEYRYWYGKWKAEKALGEPEKRESIVGLMEDMYG